jgi:hypothetical protein
MPIWVNIDTYTWPGPDYLPDHTVDADTGLWFPSHVDSTEASVYGWDVIKTLNVGDIFFHEGQPIGVVLSMETAIKRNTDAWGRRSDDPITTVICQTNGKVIVG